MMELHQKIKRCERCIITHVVSVKDVVFAGIEIGTVFSDSKCNWFKVIELANQRTNLDTRDEVVDMNCEMIENNL